MLLAEKLMAAGYEMVPFGEPCDLGIIHTCTVTREADAKSRKLVRRFIQSNPDAVTAVIGCYPQVNAAGLAGIEGIDLLVGTAAKLDLLDYVAAGRRAEPLVVRSGMSRDDFSIDFARSQAPIERRANLKIQEGCNFMCSFCIIPFARGRVRSRDMSNLLDEAECLVQRGAKEIVLTGINLGTYGFGGQSIVDVIDGLNAIRDLPRIRISSIEPTTIPEALFDRMADPGHALMPHLHIPLQSGSNTILEAMHRQYSREEFLDFIEQARDRVPGIGIGTDVMVGFPGETGADFRDTYALLEQSPVFYAHVFKYSARDGVAATRLPNSVDPKTAQQRSADLLALSGTKQRAFHEKHLGRTVEVLFEDQEDGWWTGYTGNYLRVGARSDSRLRNQLRSVLLMDAGEQFIAGNLSPETK